MGLGNATQAGFRQRGLRCVVIASECRAPVVRIDCTRSEVQGSA